MKIENILYPTDFSPSAEHALNYAIYMAKIHQASLLIFHSDEYSSLMESASIHAYYGYTTLSDTIEKMSKENLDRIAAKVPSGIAVKTRYSIGRAYHQIIMTSTEEKANMIVMGTQGRSNLTNYFLGSNAERVVRHSKCPVMTIRKSREEPEFNKIIFAMDFSPANTALLAKVIDFVIMFGAELILANIETKDIEYPDSEDAFRQIEFATDFRGLAHRTKVKRFVNVYEGLNELAEDEKADLLIIGTHGPNIGRFILGSKASGIVNHSRIPVLTFPHGR